MTRALLSALLVLVCLPTRAPALERRLAVLELVDEGAGLTAFELSALTDDVRAAALVLQRQGYVVMTRESMLALLGPGGADTLQRCTGASCEVEAGRTLGADLVVAGTVGRFAGELEARLKLFDTATASLLAQCRAQGADLRALRSSLEREARRVFPASGGAAAGAATTPIVEEGRLGGVAGAWNPQLDDGVVVEFLSEPAGALVDVDGKALCETPCSKELSAGVHRVALRKARYLGWEGDLDPAATTRVKETLAPTFGWLTVRSQPSGLAVSLNGKPTGVTPLESLELDPGGYDVLVSAPRFEEEGKRVKLEAGEHEIVDVAPVPREGALKVSVTDPAGNAVVADVRIDGRTVGRSPWSGKVQVGEVEIEVQASDGRRATRRVIIVYRQVRSETLEVGAPSAASPSAGADSASLEVWHDPRSGLEWQRASSEARYEWARAIDYCQGNEPSLPGTGWRLPTIVELKTILGDKVEEGCWRPAALSGPCRWYWSSSPYAGDDGHAWYVNFVSAYTGDRAKQSGAYVRCVRSTR